MTSMTFSHKPVEKVTSDDGSLSFDLLSQLTHMSILSLSGISRDRIFKSSGDVEDEASRIKAERLTRMINEEAKEKINSILKKVEAGEEFAQLAKRFSEDEVSREEGGFLGDLHPDSTLPEIAEEMVKLNEEETSGIIQSQYGYHILKLDEIIPSQLIPFAETKTDIMNLLLKMKTRELFETYVEDLGKKANIQIFI